MGGRDSKETDLFIVLWNVDRKELAAGEETGGTHQMIELERGGRAITPNSEAKGRKKKKRLDKFNQRRGAGTSLGDSVVGVGGVGKGIYRNRVEGGKNHRRGSRDPGMGRKGTVLTH